VTVGTQQEENVASWSMILHAARAPDFYLDRYAAAQRPRSGRTCAFVDWPADGGRLLSDACERPAAIRNTVACALVQAAVPSGRTARRALSGGLSVLGLAVANDRDCA
jgi:hypothetical protein